MRVIRGLPRALDLSAAGNLVAIVGGGGKSSLLFALTAALPGRVVATTTTRIFRSQLEHAGEVATLADTSWRAQLDSFASTLLVVGGLEGDRAHGVPDSLPGELLAHPRVDHVVVEADGSRMRPVKAPAEHEPVVPPDTTCLIAVAGIDALDEAIDRVAHRPERVSALTGMAPDQRLTPEALAALLTSPEGGLKRLPDRARAMLFINKVESDEARDAARAVARAALETPRVECVVIGALRQGAEADFEIWRDER
jgi:molybdenum cofactor cytidylyltransferase